MLLCHLSSFAVLKNGNGGKMSGSVQGFAKQASLPAVLGSLGLRCSPIAQLDGWFLITDLRNNSIVERSTERTTNAPSKWTDCKKKITLKKFPFVSEGGPKGSLSSHPQISHRAFIRKVFLSLHTQQRDSALSVL